MASTRPTLNLFCPILSLYLGASSEQDQPSFSGKGTRTTYDTYTPRGECTCRLRDYVRVIYFQQTLPHSLFACGVKMRRVCTYEYVSRDGCSCSISALHHIRVYVFIVCTRPNIFFCDPCLLYTSPSPRDRQKSRMPSSA